MSARREVRTRRAVGVTTAILAMALLTAAVQPDGPLLQAAKQGDVEAVRSLLDGGADPNEAHGDGLTALHIAAERGHVGIAELLIDAGAEVGAKTRIGSYTPLHLAGRGGHTDVALALLEAGSDPGAVTTNSGVTPLHLAATAVDGERIVAAMLKAGSPVNAREAE